MTVEIRELVIQVEVTESVKTTAPSSSIGTREWNEQRWVEKIKQEVLTHLIERGSP